MGTFKYVSNKNPNDGTEEIRLPGRAPVKMGEEIDLSDAEVDLLRQHLNLRAVSDEQDATTASAETEVGREGGDK